ncbi:MAG: general secretion pathway protein GspB [Woeseiaceae bacterium]
MSFILDALKKSEAERQRQNAPGIASIPERHNAKSSGKWVWLVTGLLAVNLLALAALLLWKSSAEPPMETPIASTQLEAPAATFSELVSEVKRSQRNSSPPVVVQPEAEDVAAPVSAPPASAENDEGGRVNPGLDSFNDLRAKGELQLPDMHLDIHVYSGAPSDRFVFVNMAKYKENSTLSEGPLVKEITPEGVVLEHQNKVFLLPRE